MSSLPPSTFSSSGPSTGANAERGRSHNRRLVLGHIQRAGKIGRAEFARATGLSIQSVSNIIAGLEADGLVREAGRRRHGRGLPAVQYALNPEGGFALGIEIRPAALIAVLMRLDGTLAIETRRPLARATPDAVADALAHLRAELVRDAAPAMKRLLGAGVVMPGPFGDTGLSGAGPVLPGWAHEDPAARLADWLDTEVTVDNDATAAAMAERLSGAARGLENFAYLYFGTGIGLGQINGGLPVQGAFGNAGEIGHLPVSGLDGPQPLEASAARISLEAHLARAGIEARSSAALEQITRTNPPALQSWCQGAAAALGEAIHVIELMCDPATILLGGAMPAALIDQIIAQIPLPTASQSNRTDRSLPRLLRGACGPLTATRGAAALVLDRAFATPPDPGASRPLLPRPLLPRSP